MNLKIFIAFGLAFSAAFGLSAADDSDIWSKYNHLKDDSDSYVGEGVAKMDEFGGDLDKALAAARQRARADLGASIRVHVSSLTTETLKSGKEGSTEELSSKSSQSSDLNIENVKLRDFQSFPASGKVTVLAYVSKEDYRRQLAGKGVKLYRLESGFRIGGGLFVPDNLDYMQDKMVQLGVPLASWELDFFWRSFYLGYEGGMTGRQEPSQLSQGASSLKMGYDWSPWNLRVQPFIPLQVEYSFWDMDPSFAQTMDASTGLGVRYWANDSVAFQILGQWHQGLLGGDVYQSGGNALVLAGHQVHINARGPELSAGINWSGF